MPRNGGRNAPEWVAGISGRIGAENAGENQVALRSPEENGYELVVSDNGVGLPKDFDPRNPASMGLRLVATLVENRLQGQIELDRAVGTKFRIEFRVEN
jgi:two-component sensor histidine kinase